MDALIKILKCIGIILLFIVLYLMFYGFMAFVCAELNPLEWHWFVRLFTAISFCSGLIKLVITLAELD